jgi:glycosyltransferase involved in cell wall biosynthesis
MLTKAISSVIKQSYESWELLIIDDASTDETEVKMNDFSKLDSRVKYLRIDRIETPGIAKYLNLGLEYSKGKYIARLDDDDVWSHKDKLKQQVEFLELNSEYVIVGGGAILIDEDGNELYKYHKNKNDEKIRKKALLSNPFTHTTVMFRRESAVSLGGYKDLKLAEDWEFWLRLGQVGKFYNIREYYANYLSAGQNLSLVNQKETARMIFKIIKLHRNNYPNYFKAFILNCGQYVYSYLPDLIKNRFQLYLNYLKRKHF